jgi:hypothetical protein
LRLPAVVLGGSVAASTALLAPYTPPATMVVLFLGEFAAFALYTWAVTKRQRQSQESAVKLIKVLRDDRISVVVRADGQLEIRPVTAGEGVVAEAGAEQLPDSLD